MFTPRTCRSASTVFVCALLGMTANMPALADNPSFDVGTGILRIPYLSVPAVGQFSINLKDTGNLVFSIVGAEAVAAAPTPTAPSIVGTWKIAPGVAQDGGTEIYFIFQQNGRFVFIEGDGELPNGAEGGTYTYNQTGSQLSLVKRFDYNINGGMFEKATDNSRIMPGVLTENTLKIGPEGASFLRQ